MRTDPRLNPVIEGNVAKVLLNTGRYTLIDAADVALVKGRNCTEIRKQCEKRYARVRGEYLHLLMFPGRPAWLQVDHINGDGLDNRRSNLRLATKQQNQSNVKKHRDNPSKYKGAFKHVDRRRKKRWAARLMVSGKLYCSYHLTELEAAKAYDALSLKLNGEFASLNFPKN